MNTEVRDSGTLLAQYFSDEQDPDEKRIKSFLGMLGQPSEKEEPQASDTDDQYAEIEQKYGQQLKTVLTDETEYKAIIKFISLIKDKLLQESLPIQDIWKTLSLDKNLLSKAVKSNAITKDEMIKLPISKILVNLLNV